jgi:hypothetical protein
MPSSPTLTREIAQLADEIRETSSVKLIDVAKQYALTICHDLWSDKFRQISSIGLSAHFVDDGYILFCIDLSCEPYNEINRRVKNILKVTKKRNFEYIPHLYSLHLYFSRLVKLLYRDLSSTITWIRSILFAIVAAIL